MTELYTLIAAIVVTQLTDVVKLAGKELAKLTPRLPSWVLHLTPLLKLVAAIAVTVLVVWVTSKFKVELTHPLAVLVIAQIAHEIQGVWKKARAEG